MFNRARSDSSELDTLALLGARERAQVVAQFDRYLADPEVGFREWDIRVRALFTFLEKDAPKPVPMFAWRFRTRPVGRKFDKSWRAVNSASQSWYMPRRFA
jgi:hypothetical protein